MVITKDEKDFKKIICEIFQIMADDERCFSNEAQLQYELALRLNDYDIVKNVELEVLSSTLPFDKFKNNTDKKFYTDIVVDLGENKYVAIELKFKTPEYSDKIKEHKTNSGKKFYTFAQGAEDEGSVLFWRDVERLEKFDEESGILLNFDKDKKVVKKFAILMTNARKYWDINAFRKFEDSLCKNFFPIDHKTFPNDLCWWIKRHKKGGYRVSGKTTKNNEDIEIVELRYDDHKKYYKYYDLNGNNEKEKVIEPIRLKNQYTCEWNDYKKTSSDSNQEAEFRYLILEVK